VRRDLVVTILESLEYSPDGDRRRQLKDAVYEQIARISKAAAAPKRLELLDLLSQGREQWKRCPI